jgi:hypothetical protein
VVFAVNPFSCTMCDVDSVLSSVVELVYEPADSPYSTCVFAGSLLVQLTRADVCAMNVGWTLESVGGVVSGVSVRNVEVEDVARLPAASRLRTRK